MLSSLDSLAAVVPPIGGYEIAAIWAFAFVGAAVQSAVGIGFALIAAAPLVLLYPALVPGPMLAATIALTVLMAHRDRAEIDFGGMGFAILGRALGSAAAAVLLSVATQRVFDLMFATMVLLAVGLSVAGLRVSATPGWAAAAGALSGLMATISSIGGPPMALLYQSAGAARLRGTLAGFFSVGTVISVVALFFAGRFGREEMALSLFLSPPTILGFYASAPLRRVLDDSWVRPLVLSLCFVSGVGVLWRALS